MPKSLPLTFAIRWLGRSQRIVQSLVRWIEAVQSAVFMGLADDEAFTRYDTHPFDESSHLSSLPEATAGLTAWEREAVERHFARDSSVLVVAAGGCRELLGLSDAGYHVHGLEYGEILSDVSNREIRSQGRGETITHVRRFDIPVTDSFDAAVIARYYLSHIRGRDNRIAFLRASRRVLRPDGQLMVSYYVRDRDTLAFRFQAAVANLVRRCRSSSDPVIEVGDHLDPESPLLHHHYTETELREELREAGFEVAEQRTTWFGWAVASPLLARARASSDEQEELASLV